MNEEIEYLRKVYQSEDTSTWINKLQMKSIVDYADQLQSNWNSLKELLKEEIENVNGTENVCFQKVYYEEVLDKMNELESGDNK